MTHVPRASDHPRKSPTFSIARELRDPTESVGKTAVNLFL